MTTHELQQLSGQVRSIAFKLGLSGDGALDEAIDKLNDAAEDIDFVAQANEEDEAEAETDEAEINEGDDT